jgi:N-acetylneuraminic acid mutarotase
MKRKETNNRRDVYISFILLMLIFSLSNNPTQGNINEVSFAVASLTQIGSDWIEMNPAIAPPARYHHWGQTAYDSESDRVILFSADNGDYSKIFNDTWAYDYNTNTWENLTTPETKNVARLGASAAYDSESDRVIVFGGWKWAHGDSVPQSTGVGETWSYDYNTNTWTNLTTENSPPFRGSCSMSYDEANDRMIMYGGFNSIMYVDSQSPIPFYGDTWAYNYNNNTWTNMSPTVSPPSLGNHESVYDSESKKTILFGGRSCREGTICPSLAETWVYDYETNTWINMNPEIRPPPRISGMMTYITTIDRVLLFGGIQLGLTSHYSDTWLYDYNTNTWLDVNSPSPPSARYSHLLEFDIESNVSILYGGAISKVDGITPSKDTWAYKYQANVPSAPLGLQGSLIDGNVNLNWASPKTDAGSPITEYVIYRGKDPESLEKYATVQGKEPLEYIDNDITKGTTYFYAVRAKNAVGESDNSNIIDIKIPTPASGFTLIILSFSLIIHSVIRRKKI